MIAEGRAQSGRAWGSRILLSMCLVRSEHDNVLSMKYWQEMVEHQVLLLRAASCDLESGSQADTP